MRKFDFSGYHFEQSCSINKFVNADSETLVCEDIFNETWETSFLIILGDHSKSAVSNEDDEKDSDSDLEIIPTLKTCPEVIQTLEDVAHFSDS